MKNSTLILQNIHHTQIEQQQLTQDQPPEDLPKIDTLYIKPDDITLTENPILTRKVSMPRKSSVSKLTTF